MGHILMREITGFKDFINYKSDRLFRSCPKILGMLTKRKVLKAKCQCIVSGTSRGLFVHRDNFINYKFPKERLNKTKEKITIHFFCPVNHTNKISKQIALKFFSSKRRLQQLDKRPNCSLAFNFLSFNCMKLSESIL